MTFVVYEVFDSMTGSITKETGDETVIENTIRFVAGQVDDLFTLVRSLDPYCPVYIDYGGKWWIRKKLSWAGIGNRYFDIEASYSVLTGDGGDLPDPEAPEDEYHPGGVSWDTTGQTRHITQAITQTKYPDDAADFHGAINVSGESVNGVDIVTPGMRYTETWILPVETVMQDSYTQAIYKLTGTVNLNNFRSFAAGEALFLGARAQWSDDSPFVSVTYEFEARANNPTWYPWEGFGSTQNLEGWEHVWIRYEDQVSADRRVKRPIAAYVSQVYEKKAWEALGIGTAPIAAPKTPLNRRRGDSGNAVGLGG
jgi:hypothetical protein